MPTVASEIIENPADDFVSAFIGAERGRRALHLKQTPHGTVVVDGEGRTQGSIIDVPDAVTDALLSEESATKGAP